MNDTSKLTRYAYVSGIVGIIVIQVYGFFFEYFDIEKNGFSIYDLELTNVYEASILFVLLMTGCSMFIIELAIRVIIEKENSICVHPILKLKGNRVGGKYFYFLGECLAYYISYLIIIYVSLFLYQNTIEYSKPFYSTWIIMLDPILTILAYSLFPYVILTRALQYDRKLDHKETVFLLWKFIAFLLDKLKILFLLKDKISNWIYAFFMHQKMYQEKGKINRTIRFDQNDSQILLGMAVKFFFIPLMFIFFLDQFGDLHRNWDYILNDMDIHKEGYGFVSFSTDIYNILYAFIFAIDVGLAWSGYVFSSRWLKNHLKSTEPTFIGWAVAILCYPPFNDFLHIYFVIPSETEFLSFLKDAKFVLILMIISLLSYSIYMSATVCFGLRFSNLTNRGIIQTGMYKYIRHPAYSGKNISWWCAMLPLMVYQSIEKGSLLPLVNILGLVFMTVLYYYRSITEEKHLLKDPEYQKYCQKVKYRFIPGLI